MSEAAGKDSDKSQPSHAAVGSEQIEQITHQQPPPGLSTSIPPIQPSSMPQLGGMMIQHGITVGQAPQNPVVMQHVCSYLSHDSDNRLHLFEARGKRSHIFRLCALGVVTLIAMMVFSIPLVALARGDMEFVRLFLDKYFQLIIVHCAGFAWRWEII